MEMNQRMPAAFWKLLDDFEDHLRGDYREVHPEIPPLVIPATGAETIRASDDLGSIAAEVRSCVRCGLHAGRKQAVPGVGATSPRVLVIGEGPGAEEDKQGEPFVGPAGKYLDKWLEALGLSRFTNVFIANAVKCRPPNNRDPLPEESEACRPFLERQIDVLRPEVILVVGRVALRALFGGSEGITRVHGQWREYKGIPVLPTFHPSAVLRDEALKRPVWEDLKKLRERLGHA